MESFKSIDDYPIVPNNILTPERLAAYNDYIKQAIEQSRKMHMVALEWTSKNFIQFHTGR